MARFSKISLLAVLSILFLAGNSRGQLRIEAGLFQQDVQILYLNDLNLTSLGSGPPLFWVRMVNESDQNRQVLLNLIVESDNPDYGRLAEGTSRPFWLGHGVEKVITNNDFSEAGSEIELDDYTIYDSAQQLADAILSTGVLPNGIYRFILTLRDAEDPSIESTATVELNISNPTSLELVSPGSRVEEGEVPVIYTSLPQFVWDSNASEFEFTVCEKLPSNSSPEDVMQNEPRYHTRTERKSLLYPSSGAYPLEEGHTYYWQVKAIIQTSSGPIALESEIWGFEIGSLQTTGTPTGGGMDAILLTILRNLLGDETANMLFDEGGELFECNPTGVILYQGRAITIQDLQGLVQKKNANQLEVIDFRVE